MTSAGFDPISWLTREQRRRTRGAFEAFGGEMAIHAIAARVRVVNEAKSRSLAAHPGGQSIQVALQDADVTQIVDLSGAYRIGGHNRVFVNIQPDEDGGVVTHAGLH